MKWQENDGHVTGSIASVYIETACGFIGARYFPTWKFLKSGLKKRRKDTK
jgi:hypothetical protein